MKNTKKTYEQALKRLEQITTLMEDSETPLEKSAELYKEAIDLAVFCSEKLTNAEGEIIVLKKEADNVFKRLKFEGE
ncbi:MAG: exodeoxyribonuclease VII small subunit [Defluviitaleaceae bacterium]|nr:exodeoxyribonuclease VII small subunit [Defluviitaleaceae bacterium]